MIDLAKITPMMRQYLEIKEQNPDALLFFRLGDFYEMFFEDAETASRELGLVLTGRDCGLEKRAPMCGIPYHAVSSYINRLSAKGYSVAICEQMTDPALSKGLVERAIIRIITPGTVIDPSMLDGRSNNNIMSVCTSGKETAAAWADVSTGEFYLSVFGENAENAVSLLCGRVEPKEIIYQPRAAESIPFLKDDPRAKEYSAAAFSPGSAGESLRTAFRVISEGSFGIAQGSAGLCASGALIRYIIDTQKSVPNHFTGIKIITDGEYMTITAAARKHLELFKTVDGERRGSLLSVIDNTSTVMGGRRIRHWLENPLQSRTAITDRQDSVQELFDDPVLMHDTTEALRDIYDIERLCGKIACGSLNPKDCTALRASLEALPALQRALSSASSGILHGLYERFDDMADIADVLTRAIIDDPPVSYKDGGVFKKGYNEELDRLLSLAGGGVEKIAAMEAREREATGIKNLKIGYNKVFGYYIEVTKANLQYVPYSYTRKQTLVNCERYINEELKELEESIISAREESVKLETALFEEIKLMLYNAVPRLKAAADIIAETDALCSLASLAEENGYVRPAITEDGVISIRDGRHPVVERLMKGRYVPNDTLLDKRGDHMMIITGPNMAGKSTYMKQVALIVILAHIGSFVPAREASVCLVDKIFTRIGASDDLLSGQSTFMTEMTETADILNNATEDSLILLDEIGRGTSTLDGLSIAASVVERLCPEGPAPKTMFSTHYHELTELEGSLPGLRNYNIAMRKAGGELIFLRKIRPGGSDKSFGIEVARLAGLPEEVLKRAENIENGLESLQNAGGVLTGGAKGNTAEKENGDAEIAAEIMERLKRTDALALSPLEALSLLYELSGKAKGE